MHLIRPGVAPCLSVLFRLFSVCAAAVLVTSACCADEPVLEFIEGLRQRKYFDTALEYIDELKQRPGLPPEIADVLELERGITFRAMATASRITEDREQALAQAEAALKAFTSSHPNHPRAAFANFELGQLLLERARSLIWEAESPSNSARRAELQQQARSLIDQAREIYQKAHDLYYAKYKEFPTFIDREKDEALYQQRQDVFNKYLRAWYNLARCTYERGQTFDKGTAERKETLIKAAEQFEEIHAANRSTVIGRLSRLMMGKCFQEQDDISRALGLYNEIIDDKSDHPTALLLKSYAVQFRLICLNHEKKNDHRLVIQEATEWLNDRRNRSRLYTEQGLGILWERAIAEEKLAQNRELDAAQRTALLRQAASDAKQVARFPSPYREAAVAMGRRISAELGEKDKDPADFDSAFERGRGLVTQLKGLKESLAAAKTPEEKQKAQQAIDLHLAEIGRMFQLALDLRTPDSDPKAVAQARYLLSYAYLQQRKSFEALILARYCMTRDKLNDPDSALSATEIAINAAIQAFNDAGEDKDFELGLLKDVCELIITQYAQSAKGNEARIRLGQVYRDLDQPIKAAEIYLTVPPEYSGYPSARMQAGQSYWLAWVRQMAQAQEQQAEAVDQATLDAWKANAEKYLLEGLDAARKRLGTDGKPTDEMVAAEVSLATILNMDGRFNETVQRLTAGGKNSVLAAIDVPKGQPRPEKGVRSAPFASQTYRLLLRAYIGTQQVDKALQTMDRLESLGGQNMAAIYTELGRELQEELARLNAAGETDKLNQTRQQFEAFLAKVYERRDSKDYNSLLWIGETYYGLGQGVIDDPVAAPQYFEKATSAYEEILQNNLVEGPTVGAIQLRIIRCKRALKQYEQAVQMAQDLLSKSPLSLDVQFEAAYTLADWGADENAGQPEKLLTSIEGIKGPDGKPVIWGWKGITTRLQARRNTPDWNDFRDKFLEAKYEYVNSRVRYAKTGAPDGEKQLRSALAEITVLAQVFTDLPDRWFSKFDRLYQEVQQQLAMPEVKPLERPKPVEIPPEELAGGPDATEETTEEQASEEQAADSSPKPSGPNPLLIGVALLLAAGGGFAFYVAMSKPPRRAKTIVPPPDAVLPPVTAGDAVGPADDSSGVPDFSNIAGVGAPPAGVALPGAKKKVRRAATAASGAGPAKKKRKVTPEEAARIRAARAKKAAAQAGSDPAAEAERRRKLAARKKAAQQQQGNGGQVAPDRKIVKKKRQPPPEA